MSNKRCSCMDGFTMCFMPCPIMEEHSRREIERKRQEIAQKFHNEKSCQAALEMIKKGSKK